MMRYPWSKFYWADWRGDPALRASSVAARGLWMDLLCIAAEADPTGYVLINGRTPSITDLARLTGAPEGDVQSWLEELDRNGVFSRDRHGRMYSRRMVRDMKKARTAQKNGALGGNPRLSKQREIPPSDNPQDNVGDKPKKLEARSQKDSVAVATGPLAPLDLEKEFWRTAVGYLGDRHRSLVGKWRQQHGAEAVMRALSKAQAENPADPVEFIVGCLRSQAHGRKQSQETAVAGLYEGAAIALARRAQRQADCGAGDHPAEPLLDSERGRTIEGVAARRLA